MRLPALFVALASLAPFAGAQDAMVLQLGDPVTGLPGTTISSISSYGIASTGDWWASARFTAQNPDGYILVINGVTEFKFGDALQGGYTFSRAFGADFSAVGDVAVHCAVLPAGAQFPDDALLWNGAVVATKDTPIVDGSGAVVASIDRFEEFVLDGNDRILARVILSPFTIPVMRALVEIEPNAPGPNQARMLLRPGMIYPDGSEVVTLERVDVNGRGDVMVSGKEIPSAGSAEERSVRVNGSLRVRSGDTEPTSGATWNLNGPIFGGTSVDFDLDAQGEVTIYGNLVDAGGSTRAIVRAGNVVARVGQTLAGSTAPIAAIAQYGLSTLPDGRVLWSGVEQGVLRPNLYLGGETYLQPNDALLGSAVRRVQQASNVEISPLTDNGGFLLYRVDLVDDRIGLLRRPLSIGRFGCAQQTANSSGSVARLEARGSDLAGGNELVLVGGDLPPGQLGLFAVSSAAGLILPAGSQGTLCLGGSIGRFGDIFQVDLGGNVEFGVDTTALPTSPNVAAMPGDTWHFQGWFRDSNPGATSNTTDSVLVTFR